MTFAVFSDVCTKLKTVIIRLKKYLISNISWRVEEELKHSFDIIIQLDNIHVGDLMCWQVRAIKQVITSLERLNKLTHLADLIYEFIRSI